MIGRVRFHMAEHEHIYLRTVTSKHLLPLVNLVYRAATQNGSVQAFLPAYSSLLQPPSAAMEYLDNLATTMQCLIGSLPITNRTLLQQPWSYLSWLQIMLLDFQDRQHTECPPKLLAMSLQSSNAASFITISTASLQK